MKQWIRSMVLLALPVVVWGCKSDPTVSDAVGVPAKLVASPQSIFVTQDVPEPMSVTLLDANDNPVPGEFTFTQPADAGIAVTLDTSVALIYDAAGNLVQKTGVATARFNVAATGLAASSFDVSAAGLTTTINVVSVPPALTATLSSKTPALGQTVTITTPPDFTVSSTATVTKSTTDATSAGLVTARTDHSITYLPTFGGNGPVAVRGISPVYAPAATLNLNTTDTVVVGDATTLTKIAGTDAIATAPTIIIPAAGVSTAFYDKPPFGFGGGCVADEGDNCDIYKITVATTRKFHVNLAFEGTSDLGVFFLAADGSGLAPGVGTADAGGTGGGAEAADITLDPGTYYMAVLRFTYAGSTVDPAYYLVTLTGL